MKKARSLFRALKSLALICHLLFVVNQTKCVEELHWGGGWKLVLFN